MLSPILDGQRLADEEEEECPKGKYSKEGASSCTNCPAGTSGGGDALRTTNECNGLCGVGKSSTEAWDQALECEDCPESLEVDHNVELGIKENKLRFLVMFTRAMKRFVDYKEGALREAWSLMKLNIKRQRRRSKQVKKFLVHEQSKKLLLANRRTSQYHRNDEEVGYLMQWMLNSKIFPKDLPQSMLKDLCLRMENKVLKKGDVLFLQGDPGDCYYIIIEGSIMLSWQEDEREALKLRLLHDEHPSDFKKTDFLNSRIVGKQLKEMESGISFGELSMMSEEATQRTCSAIANSHSSTGLCQLCVINRELYDRTLKTYHLKKGKKDETFGMLSKMPAFKKWVPEVTKQLVEAGTTHIYRHGDFICNKDQEIDTVFIVLTGEVASVSDMRRKGRRNSGQRLIQHKAGRKVHLSENETELCRATGGSILGDVEIFHSIPTYVISSIVRSSDCSFLSVPLEEFTNLAKINREVWRDMHEDAKKKMEFLNLRFVEERKKGKKKLKIRKTSYTESHPEATASLANAERLGIIQKINLAQDLNKLDKEQFELSQSRKLPAIVLQHRKHSSASSLNSETTARMYSRNYRRRPSLLATPAVAMRNAPTSGSQHSLQIRKPNPYTSLKKIMSLEQNSDFRVKAQVPVILMPSQGISKFKKR
ncbi:hypothetical protein TL16_g06440 [Triparma laevis f. inornata]|uniref:Cyclic nucleotide-binding domain-containing protein n=1 Tax=Triparma laevis f. inornata TaxID=1714386 RepID=A0A9W7ANE4_9STRA|nr:hypothetical protein TL16_g06440 [Triparma laevis f. inornata]